MKQLKLFIQTEKSEIVEQEPGALRKRRTVFILECIVRRLN